MFVANSALHENVAALFLGIVLLAFPLVNLLPGGDSRLVDVMYCKWC